VSLRNPARRSRIENGSAVPSPSTVIAMWPARQARPSLCHTWLFSRNTGLTAVDVSSRALLALVGIDSQVDLRVDGTPHQSRGFARCPSKPGFPGFTTAFAHVTITGYVYRLSAKVR
jgi:hypothetical protein